MHNSFNYCWLSFHCFISFFFLNFFFGTRKVEARHCDNVKTGHLYPSLQGLHREVVAVLARLCALLWLQGRCGDVWVCQWCSLLLYIQSLSCLCKVLGELRTDCVSAVMHSSRLHISLEIIKVHFGHMLEVVSFRRCRCYIIYFWAAYSYYRAGQGGNVSYRKILRVNTFQHMNVLHCEITLLHSNIFVQLRLFDDTSSSPTLILAVIHSRTVSVPLPSKSCYASLKWRNNIKIKNIKTALLSSLRALSSANCLTVSTCLPNQTVSHCGLVVPHTYERFCFFLGKCTSRSE